MEKYAVSAPKRAESGKHKENAPRDSRERSGNGESTMNLDRFDIDALHGLLDGLNNLLRHAVSKHAPKTEIDRRMAEVKRVSDRIARLETEIIETESPRLRDRRANGGWAPPYHLYGNGPERRIEGLGTVQLGNAKRHLLQRDGRGEDGLVKRTPNLDEEDRNQPGGWGRRKADDESIVLNTDGESFDDTRIR